MKKVCQQGHRFNKTSDCSICHKCEAKKEYNPEFPKLSAPAMRALKNANILSLKDLSKWSECELLNLHGFGPSSIKLLRNALKAKKLTFK
jgi:hypothetical protein